MNNKILYQYLKTNTSLQSYPGFEIKSITLLNYKRVRIEYKKIDCMTSENIFITLSNYNKWIIDNRKNKIKYITEL